MSATAIPLRSRPGAGIRAAAREQARLAAGQLAAGAGNLAFALVCARLLAPRDYSLLAAFLAAYLLLYMPFSSLSAGGALAPGSRGGARGLRIGVPIGVALLVAAAAGLAPELGLAATLMLALGLSAPVAGPLALERGLALGDGRPRALVASLLAEPAVRLALGIPAAVAFGAPGAAGAVVLGGYAARQAARRGASSSRRAPATAASAPAVAATRAAGGAAVTVAFLLLAVLQNQDVLWASARLAAPEAARFAVLSTLGGIVAFATTTVPLALLPRSARGERGALPAAVGAAAVLGAGALLPALIDGRGLAVAVFGDRYGAVAPLLVPYLLAMALLGVARVLVAHRCATAGARPVLWLLGACAAGQALLIVALGGDAAGVAHATLAASTALALGLTALVAGPALAAGGARQVPSGRLALPWSRPRLRLPTTAAGWALPALTLAGLLLRLGAGRSLWLDEATSISQAQMPFGTMWTNLRSSDVQPPLHDAVLWVIDRIAGDGELAMRSPSLVAGTLLVPLVYVIGRDLWERRTGLVAATLTSAAPFVVWYSQEARMYALYMLLAGLALWSQVRILTERRPGDDDRRWGWWLLYSLSTVALAWTQYLGALFALVQQAAFVAALVSRRAERRALLVPWLASVALIAVLVAPLVPFVAHQYEVNQASGRGFGVAPAQNGSDLEAGHRTPTVYALLTNLVWGVWGYHSTATMQSLTALWPAGILLALALLGRGRSWRVTLLVALAGVPMAILFAIGQAKPFLFEIRYFCAAVPVAMLLLARACATWTGRRGLGAAAATAVLVASFLWAFDDQQFSQTNPRLYDFQGALARIHRELRPGDELLYAPQYLGDLVGYYRPGMPSAPLTADPAGAAPHGRVFVMASFQQQPQNRRFLSDALARLRLAHRAELETFKRPQVQVWLYS